MMEMRRIVNWMVGVVVLLFLVTPMVCSVAGSSTALAADKFMADRHMDKGLKCSSCHNQNPPTRDVYKEDCLKCHGPEYKDLEKKTSKVVSKGEIRNPHAGHNGETQCDSCHHGHKAPEKDPEEACAACHNWGFTKVP
ncbi:MAG: cytochrome c3 family protein [Deltaproteobacteria bacterium]|nr:cytochrome c3 family protein [Deltaproteobacteria bacterium]